MPAVEEGRRAYELDEYTEKALGLVLSGARAARIRSTRSRATRCAIATARTPSASLACSRAASSRRARASCRSTGPKVANSDLPLLGRARRPGGAACATERRRCSIRARDLIADLDERGMLEDTLGRRHRRVRPRARRSGLSTSGKRQRRAARTTGHYCFTAVVAGGGMRRGHVYGESDATGSAPIEDPLHPVDLLATIYHALGIDPKDDGLQPPESPRELVQGEPVTSLFA
jgi:hypothetical protein